MSNGRGASGTYGPLTLLFAAAVGVIGGLVGTLFQLASSGLQHALIGAGRLYDAARALPWHLVLLIPCAGAALSGLLLNFLGRRRETQGMANVMESVSLRKAQELQPTRTLGRALASLALIATGGSVGREGPIVYLSATFGARFSRLVRVPGPRLGLFAGCGIAAGMSAAYYAPFGAALFAMEVVLANFAFDIFAPVVVASVVSNFFVTELARGPLAGILKGPPLYDLPPMAMGGRIEILLYLLLGVASAFGAWLFVRGMSGAEAVFRQMPVPLPARMALGGLLVGAIGLWFPEVWGNGYDAVSHVLREAPAIGWVALLFALKIAATSITIGSGGSGGIFTPTLFVGGALGYLLGSIGERYWPDEVSSPAAFAVVGMASVLAATTHAPITAIFLLFEMTRETEIILPLLLAPLAALSIGRRIGVESVYFAPLRRRGVRLPEGIEETTLTTTRVGDIMRPDAVFVLAGATFDVIIGMVQKTRKDSLYVVGPGRALHGAIRLHDIKNYLAHESLGSLVVAADLSVQVPVALPAQSLAEILEKFDDPELHEMPVIDPQSRELLGVVDRRDLISALSVEVLKSRSLRAKFVSHEGTANFVELPKGHSIARVPVPRTMWEKTLGSVEFRKATGLSVLTIVRNEGGRDVRLLPEPHTLLRPGDAIIVVGPEEAVRELEGQ